MRKPITILACVLILTAASAQNVEPDMAVRASLIDLLMNAERFADRRVAVYGYLDRHAGLGLFLTKEHAEGRDWVSAISVADTDNMDVYNSGCLDSYVVLTGAFIKSDTDYVFTAITRVYDPVTATVCWESR